MKTTGRQWAGRTAVVGTVFIALGAFWLSFTALADLAARSGVDRGQAWAWPLIVDGIIVVATVAVVALAGQRSAWYPWSLLVGGALVSVPSLARSTGPDRAKVLRGALPVQRLGASVARSLAGWPPRLLRVELLPPAPLRPSRSTPCDLQLILRVQRSALSVVPIRNPLRLIRLQSIGLLRTN